MKGKNEEILLSLLRSALWGEEFLDKLSQEEFTQVLRLAKEQTVVGLVFDILKDTKIEGAQNKALIFDTLGLTERIKHHNLLIDRELISFAQRCKDVGQDYLVVKGQTLGCLYRNPVLRSAGDIDFLVPNITTNISDMFPGCKKHQRIWEDLIDEEWKRENYVTIGGIKVRTLSATVNAVYLFLHLYFHFIREGVSLRQFCDWAIMLHHYRNEIDRNRLAETLRQLDMINGFKAFGCILVDELGLREEEFPLSLANEDRIQKGKILEDVFKGGNFGKQNHKAKTALGFKFETLRMALRNSIRYRSLAPSEMQMMIPKMVKINLKLLAG